ncbi:hypothetical protein GQS40_08410|uniref:Magnesium transporter MgtE intracellular domain-containing protein n=1 Tax=Leuconostoc lactis TaxID=1246 RepID=A0A6L7AGC8_LEULA|nr:hypothetical protein [Leuconostoc lactis]
MSTEYLAVKEDLKVGEVMRLVKKQALEAESISYVSLPEQFRAVAWRLLPTDILAAVFDNLDVDEVDIAGLLAEMPPQRGAQILQEMYTDNAVDLLQEMPSVII